MTEGLHPWVWWVKVRDVEGAVPTRFELDHRGRMWAVHEGGRLLLPDDYLRRLGYEKCYCCPLTPGIVDDECVVHNQIGI